MTTKAKAKAKASKSKTKKRKKVLTPEEAAKIAHIREIQGIFRNAGFTRVGKSINKDIHFKGRTGEIDDIFVVENVVIVAEYTSLKPGKGLSGHLLKKKVILDLIHDNPEQFVEQMDAEFPAFADARDSLYSAEQCRAVLLYASKSPLEDEHKNQLKYVSFFDYPVMKYFDRVAKSVKKSARFELFAFMGLSHDQIGTASVKPGAGALNYEGTLLPESHTNFPKNHKVISFYIDPESLLSKAYVLRREGWLDENDLYQRMVSSNKINSIRRYLNENERVFVNNIIVTLPNSTRLLKAGSEIDAKTIKKAQAVTIQIPEGFNIIGLVDGQHRVFAYHEGGVFEPKIEKLRKMQNLLATGIIYPPGMSSKERSKFESRLFLEINSTQANASSDLKQTIALLLRPFSAESIAKAVLNGLNAKGTLAEVFEVRFYETDKLKTTSVVSYALKPLVKLGGIDSLFALWSEKNKAQLADVEDLDLLTKYIKFSVSQLDMFFSAVKQQASASQWTSERSVKNKILSTTAINGLINCYRFLIEFGKTGDFEYYKKRLAGLSKFDFSKYKSSQYRTMGQDLYSSFF